MACCEVQLREWPLPCGAGLICRFSENPKTYAKTVQSPWTRKFVISRAGLHISKEGGRKFQLPSAFVKGKRLSELSTFGIGGPAKYFIQVHTELELALVLEYCRSHGLRQFIVGKGSNCLFDDRGFDGCVILNSLDFVDANGDGIYRVGSGHAFNRLGIQCSKDGYSGLEFASGIPGTVGGAIFMNASANGQATADVLKSVEVLTADGKKVVHADGLEGYGYRKSPYQALRASVSIVAATFQLTSSSVAGERSRAFLARRQRTQPVTELSAGCVFRNPGDDVRSAGKLIELAGLKGFSVGRAEVSAVHANFLVNTGNARAEDILTLILHVKERVRNVLGVELKKEIIYVPYR